MAKMSRNRCSALYHYLPQELVTEVLFRLPVKSLLRFKCVCKDWFTIINDPQFAKAQLRHIKPVVGLFSESIKPDILSTFNLEVEEGGGGGRIDFNLKELVRDSVIPQASCNGLLLTTKNSVRQFYICNPSTRWHLKLPQFFPNNHDFCNHVRHHILYSKSALAYDNSKQKYKVIITVGNFGISGDTLLSESYKCGVFTVGEKEGDARDGSSCGSWREFDMPAAYKPIHRQPHSFSVNGSLHSMGVKRPEHDVYIFSMDLATEEFREIRSPVKCAEHRHYVLLEMNGSLCLFYPLDHRRMDLWVLYDPVKQAWNKQFHIDIGPNLDYYWFYPVLVMEESFSPVTLFLKRLHWEEKELVFYNLDNQQFKVVHRGIGSNYSTKSLFMSIALSAVNLSNPCSFGIHIFLPKS